MTSPVTILVKNMFWLICFNFLVPSQSHILFASMPAAHLLSQLFPFVCTFNSSYPQILTL